MGVLCGFFLSLCQKKVISKKYSDFPSTWFAHPFGIIYDASLLREHLELCAVDEKASVSNAHHAVPNFHTGADWRICSCSVWFKKTVFFCNAFFVSWMDCFELVAPSIS